MCQYGSQASLRAILTHMRTSRIGRRWGASRIFTQGVALGWYVMPFQGWWFARNRMVLILHTVGACLQATSGGDQALIQNRGLLPNFVFLWLANIPGPVWRLDLGEVFCSFCRLQAGSYGFFADAVNISMISIRSSTSLSFGKTPGSPSLSIPVNGGS